MRRTFIHYLILLPALALITLSCSEDSSSPTNNDPEPEPVDGMVLIPASGSSFSMGSNNGFTDELPVHTVSFEFDFWMDTTEVTQGDYDELMSETYSGYTSPDWHNPYGDGDNYPVYEVLWSDAILYCNARSLRDGLDTVYSYTNIVGTPGNQCQLEGVSADLSRNGYRLPTESEWEFACRANSTTDFYWGKNHNPYPVTSADTIEIGNNAVWRVNSWDFGVDSTQYGTHPVGTKTPNAFGLYDMSGNLYEWCHDWYGDYAGGSQTDPIGPEAGDWHVIRGGSWGNDANYLRTTNRTFLNPGYSYYFIGFRTVLRQQ